MFKEKDRWAIDINRLKALGLRRGKWLKELKKKGKVIHKKKKIKVEDIAYVSFTYMLRVIVDNDLQTITFDRGIIFQNLSG